MAAPTHRSHRPLPWRRALESLDSVRYSLRTRPRRALLAQKGGPDELRTVLWHILQVNAEIDQKQLGDVMLKHFGPEAEEIAVTAGQRLIQQGRQQGRQEERVRMLLKLLSLRFGELSSEITARVQAADEQALERLSERVITASTLSGVFDDS